MLDGERRPRHFVVAIQDISERKRAEAELRESEERYRLVVRATRSAAWDWDLLTDRMVWGEGFERCSVTLAERVTTTAAWWYEQIHADDRERVVAGSRTRSAGATGPGGGVPLPPGRRDLAPVADRIYVVTDPSGEPVRVVGAMAGS